VVCYVEVKNAADGNSPRTRTVVVHGRHRLGISLKLAAAAIIVALLAAETALPPLAVAAGLAAVLTALVYLDRTLLAQTQLPAWAQNG
jgi:hypothetical protein